MSDPALPSRKQPAPAPRPRRWGRILGLTLLTLLVLLLLLGIGGAKGWVPEPVVSAVARVFVGRQADVRPWSSDQPANVLVMGLQIGGASTNPLTDSMMVASYQPDGNKAAMLSIPRDTWVTIPGHGEGRINEAFQDGGAQEAMLTVQQNLGVPVNYYAIVSYDSLTTLIDDVGGITVEVAETIDDPTFPAPDEIHFDPFHLEKGTHRLNGYDALRYARTRHGDTDFARADRQQQVLVALRHELTKPVNWLKLPVILRDLRSTVRTNLPFDQAVTIGLRVLGGGLDNLHRDVLQPSNGAVKGFTTAGGAQVLAPNPKVIGELVLQSFGPSLAILQGEGTVRVDNGNGYKGAATQFSAVLKGMGVTVPEPGDADRKDYAHNLVRVSDRAAGRAMQKAKLIAGMLGAEVEKVRTAKDEVDIQVILGLDYAPFVEFRAKDWDDAIKPR